MNAPAQTTQRADVRDYLAAERTFLAWIRTGVALMGFEFVVARFGIFLRELQASQHAFFHSYGLSLWFGTALIGVGVIANIFAARTRDYSGNSIVGKRRTPVLQRTPS